jgi:hypothetical protein
MRTNYIYSTRSINTPNVTEQVARSLRLDGQKGLTHNYGFFRLLHPGSCICLLCGEYLEVLLKLHVERHGYSSKEAFEAAGHVRWL